VRKETSVTR